jgi:hypothetical protein
MNDILEYKAQWYAESSFSLSFGATAPIWTLAYLHETPFDFSLLDLRHSVGHLGRVISSSQGL